jgi:hypothetical protein
MFASPGTTPSSCAWNPPCILRRRWRQLRCRTLVAPASDLRAVALRGRLQATWKSRKLETTAAVAAPRRSRTPQPGVYDGIPGPPTAASKKNLYIPVLRQKRNPIPIPRVQTQRSAGRVPCLLHC